MHAVASARSRQDRCHGAPWAGTEYWSRSRLSCAASSPPAGRSAALVGLGALCFAEAAVIAALLSERRSGLAPAEDDAGAVPVHGGTLIAPPPGPAPVVHAAQRRMVGWCRSQTSRTVDAPHFCCSPIPPVGPVTTCWPRQAPLQAAIADQGSLMPISAGSPMVNAAMAEELGIDMLMQEDFEVGDAYGVQVTPEIVVVMPDGRAVAHIFGGAACRRVPRCHRSCLERQPDARDDPQPVIGP